MLLAIDVGNTQTVLGVYEGEKLLHMWRLATNVDYTSDELRIKLHALLRAEDLDGVKFDGAVHFLMHTEELKGAYENAERKR